MSLSKIKNLVQQREKQLKPILDKAEALKSDERYSQQYKNEELKKLRSLWEEIDSKYREQIHQEAREVRKALLQKYHNEPKEDAASEMYKLRQLMQIQHEADLLVKEYQGTNETGLHHLRMKANEWLDAGITVKAEPIIMAICKLGGGGHDLMEKLKKLKDEQYPHRREALAGLAELDQLMQEVEKYGSAAELGSKTSSQVSLEHALRKHFSNQLGGVNQWASKRSVIVCLKNWNTLKKSRAVSWNNSTMNLAR